VDEYILQFKAKASQTDLGDTTLVEYLKAGLNPVLFKYIYQLPVMPETLKEWYEWAKKLDWQYRQEQTESNLLGHSLMMHKPHKMTGGGHKRAQAQASAWAQLLASTVTPNAHTPQMHQQVHQHQPQNSDNMDVDQGGRHPPLKCYSCGNLGHTAKFCRNKRQIHGGNDLGDREKDFVEESQ